MEKITGNIGAPLIICANPKRDKWKIRWNVTDNGDGTANYMEQDLDHRPTIDEVKSIILGWYNERINERIVSGFVWRKMPVWLSSENQFNYKAAHDRAVMSNGETLPVTFKFGTDEAPIYWVFNTVADIRDFYDQMTDHILKVQSEGWSEKDNINFDEYQIYI